MTGVAVAREAMSCVLDRIVEDRIAAAAADRAHATARDIMDRAVCAPCAVAAALGEPRKAGVGLLRKADELTILNAAWKPGAIRLPHNHDMWAIIGVYGGRDDKMFWRRIKDDPDGRV